MFKNNFQHDKKTHFKKNYTCLKIASVPLRGTSGDKLKMALRFFALNFSRFSFPIKVFEFRQANIKPASLGESVVSIRKVKEMHFFVFV